MADGLALGCWCVDARAGDARGSEGIIRDDDDDFRSSLETAVARAPEPQAAKGVEAGIDLAWLSEKIDYRRFMECVHCGLCTASCPTYIETGNENDSPRGRIYLMRAVTDGRLGMSDDVRRHLNLCLDCRACETACPSGVKYGQMIEPFKVALHQTETEEDRTGWLMGMILKHLFPYRGRVKLRFCLRG